VRDVAVSGLSIVLAVCLAACSRPEATTATWNRDAAAAYLDRRAEWWMGWQGAARDRGTFCISCHTALPYALSRAALRMRAGDASSDIERRLLDNVVKRVRLWNEIAPYYHNRAGDPSKAVESRGTESILNALILADHDGRNGRLSAETRSALDNMWALQQTTGERAGAWPWLRFGLSPWEADGSEYYGAALAARAVGAAPEQYASSPAIQENLKRLRAYLSRECSTQPLSNRVVVLWASTKLAGLLDPERQASLVDEILAAQRADGGWALSSRKSDAYATGLAVLALLELNTPRADGPARDGVSWLMRNQNSSGGFWPLDSPNMRRDPTSDVGRFMSDAATAYAALALATAGR
jgi:squalene-hopene/tetraprenyl-beta-curcumene cyclase